MIASDFSSCSVDILGDSGCCGGVIRGKACGKACGKVFAPCAQPCFRSKEEDLTTGLLPEVLH